MARKNLQSIASALQPAAENLPTQKDSAPSPAPPETPTMAEPIVQFSFGLRRSQRKQLARLAAEDDMTMRAFILNALKEKGLEVSSEDLLDLRRKG
ncbi:hypothetical protein, partial [uncultured Tateyamaria sp.]|uniref:hypothetical protein n=1 Tax=uncultured Tateyamaria sp. TaxID=455651 RepID=UPI00263A1618